MVEATGNYAELHASGLNFVKQLGLEIEAEDRQEKQLSLRTTKRQNSETSEHVSLFAA